MVGNVEICRASPRRATVVMRKTATDRTLVKGVTAKFKIRVTVISNYLFIWSGKFIGRGSMRIKEHYSVRRRPAIPGSSLKGAVRSRIELASIGDRVPAVFLYDSGALKALPEVGVHGWRHARIWCESVFEEREENRLYRVGGHYGCCWRWF